MSIAVRPHLSDVHRHLRFLGCVERLLASRPIPKRGRLTDTEVVMRTSAAASNHGSAEFGRPAHASTEASAWTAFWQEQDSESRCLRSAPGQLHDLLSDHWNSFAANLPPGTKVLDIGCGSGIVGRSLVRAQPSLHVVGIDAARVRAVPSCPNVKILTEIAIEALPFVDKCCGAAASQFGFEYSDTSAAAKELARVLNPGARFSFIIHHSASPIVLGDHLHGKALRAALSDDVRGPFLAGDAAALSETLTRLQRQFPDETTLWLLARGLLERIAGTLQQRHRLWNAVKEALAPDLILSDALKASCVAPAEIEGWLTPLGQAFDVDRPSILQIHGQPLAWKIEGRRKIR